jgi:antitoxin ParD1/3/4
MMPTQNVNLSDQQVQFIRQSVDGGRYRNASEVVRAGLRALEQNEQEDRLKLRRLRRLAKQAFDEIDHGHFEEIDSSEIDDFMTKVAAKVRAAKS